MSESESPPHALSSIESSNHSEMTTYQPITQNQNKINRNNNSSPHDTSPHPNKLQNFYYSNSDSDFSIGVKHKIGTNITRQIFIISG
jgi:hypothetical protein